VLPGERPQPAGERTVLEAGDSLHFPSTNIHSTWNHTDQPAPSLWIGTMDVFRDSETEGAERRS
jgi:uncharacterized cupin superfamily protein